MISHLEKCANDSAEYIWLEGLDSVEIGELSCTAQFRFVRPECALYGFVVFCS